MISSSRSFSPGTLVGGQFEIEEILARGGMGVVYRAVQRVTGAKRALKIMHPMLVSDDRNRKLFVQESQASSLIRSEHVVEVIAAGVDEDTGVPWLAMELLEGADLGHHLAQHGAMPPGDVVLAVQQMCHALGAAHDQGIIHRDLKPANIFLASADRFGSSCMVKLLDFGVAKFLSNCLGDTRPVGTPSYMAPEQTEESEQVTAAADIWALGLIVFEMLVARSYWRTEGSHVAAVWRELLFDPIDLASERAAEFGLGEFIPAQFDEWFVRCVNRDRANRFPDARIAGAALAALLSPGRADTLPDLSAPQLWHSESALDWTPPPGGLPHSPSSLFTGTPTGLVKVTYRSRLDREIVNARPGATLLQTSLENDLPHTHVCGGQARCTTCRIVVLKGEQNLSERTEEEQGVADQKRWPDNIRLACQARVMGPVTVRRLVMDAEDALLVAEEPPQPGFADKASACVLATASRGLNAFSRSALPYDVVHVVNRLLRQIGEGIEHNRGQVVRVSGPDVIAIFGHGDEDRSTAAISALRAALRILVRVAVLNQHFVQHFGVSVKVTVGLDDGEVLLGDVGYPEMQSNHAFGEGVIVAQAAAIAASRQNAQIFGSERFCQHFAEPLQTGRRVNARVSGVDLGLVEIRDFHKPDAIFLVQSSFERVAARADEFVQIFYERLWALAPATRALFEHVDMVTQRQMLAQTLASAVRGLDNIDDIAPQLADLARRHVGYGTKIKHYKVLGTALIQALEAVLGADFAPEARMAWIEIYGQIARIMMEAAMQATPT